MPATAPAVADRPPALAEPTPAYPTPAEPTPAEATLAEPTTVPSDARWIVDEVLPCLQVGPRGIIGRVEGKRRVASATGPARSVLRATGVVVPTPPAEDDLADETPEPKPRDVADPDAEEIVACDADEPADASAGPKEIVLPEAGTVIPGVDEIAGAEVDAAPESDQAADADADADGDEATAAGGATEACSASLRADTAPPVEETSDKPSPVPRPGTPRPGRSPVSVAGLSWVDRSCAGNDLAGAAPPEFGAVAGALVCSTDRATAAMTECCAAVTPVVVFRCSSAAGEVGAAWRALSASLDRRVTSLDCPSGSDAEAVAVDVAADAILVATEVVSISDGPLGGGATASEEVSASPVAPTGAASPGAASPGAASPCAASPCAPRPARSDQADADADGLRPPDPSSLDGGTGAESDSDVACRVGDESDERGDEGTAPARVADGCVDDVDGVAGVANDDEPDDGSNGVDSALPGGAISSCAVRPPAAPFAGASDLTPAG